MGYCEHDQQLRPRLSKGSALKLSLPTESTEVPNLGAVKTSVKGLEDLS